LIVEDAMGVVLTVKGTIRYGDLKAFSDAVGHFLQYRAEQGWAVPEVLHGLSGPMNTVLMVFRYDDLAAYENEMKQERRDGEYGGIAAQMPYAEGSIVYELYQDDGE
jgi:hypothetical protein